METLEQKIDCLEIAKKGIELEYEYVKNMKNKEIEELKRKIAELNSEVESDKKEKEELEQTINHLKIKLEKIEYSRWWRIRNFLKNKKSKEV